MNTLEAIYNRRSIRKFKSDNVPSELIEKVLDAAIRAPSAMNSQPWRFVVLEGDKKNELIQIFQNSIDKTKIFKKSAGAAKNTAELMKNAPVLILVFNANRRAGSFLRLFTSVSDVLFIQSIGGAIQTMLLAAHELGLGTLWVGHIFFAVKEIRKFSGKNEELIAAVSMGYADETPPARLRKNWQEVTEWLK